MVVIAANAAMRATATCAVERQEDAQKGGAVWSHIKVYEKDNKPFSHKISPASANLLLACDAVVGTKPEIQEVLSDKRTNSLVNTNTIPVADFVTNRDIDFKSSEVFDLIEKTTNSIEGVPAVEMAEKLTGDAIGGNMIMLGAAFQMGLIPLKEESIIAAIELNKISIESNIYSFRLGRAYIANPKNEIFKFLQKDTGEKLSNEEVLADRENRLMKYDPKVSQEFSKHMSNLKKVLETELEPDASFRRAIKEAYRVCAIKDEYEVARMHIETSKQVLDNQFNSWSNLSFYLSPPFLSFIKDQRTGRPKKYRVPGFIAMPLFHILAKLKFLRGTAFDPLSMSGDRKRDLQHKDIFFNRLAELSSLTAGQKTTKLNRLLDCSEAVKGYGPVREEAFKQFLIRIDEKSF